MKKRALAALLCAMLISTLVACDIEPGGLVGELLGGNENIVEGVVPEQKYPDTDMTVGDEQTWIDQTWPDIETQGPVEELNPDAYRGYELVIAGQNVVDLGYEEVEGNVVSVLSYARNHELHSTYGITVNAVMLEREDLTDMVKNDVTSGTGEYHMVYGSMCEALNDLMPNGYLYSLYDLPYVDLTSAAWDQSMHEGLAIGKYLPMATGAITPDASLQTSLLLFNAQMAEENGFDLFAYAAYGDWTIDKMYSVCKITFADLNGDAVLELENDRFGFVGSHLDAQAFATGFGASLISKDENNLPMPDTVAMDRMQAAYSDFYKLATSSISYYVTRQESLQNMDALTNCFADGRALLWASDVQGALEMMNADTVRYGILPYPKLDQSQEQYCSYVDCQATAVMVPEHSDSEKLALAGYALEAMAQISQRLYYDKLAMRVAPTEKDMEMIQLVWQTKTLDFGSNYFFMSMACSQSFASAMESGNSSVISQISAESKRLAKELEMLKEAAGQ